MQNGNVCADFQNFESYTMYYQVCESQIRLCQLIKKVAAPNQVHDHAKLKYKSFQFLIHVILLQTLVFTDFPRIKSIVIASAASVDKFDALVSIGVVGPTGYIGLTGYSAISVQGMGQTTDCWKNFRLQTNLSYEQLGTNHFSGPRRWPQKRQTRKPKSTVSQLREIQNLQLIAMRAN